MDRNEMKIEFGSDPRNESFARVVVASFMTRTNPTLEEVAVSCTYCDAQPDSQIDLLDRSAA